MDIKCRTCGEPWETDYLRHDLSNPPDPRWIFGGSRMILLHCPSCPAGAKVDEEFINTWIDVAAVCDDDGLASIFGD